MYVGKDGQGWRKKECEEIRMWNAFFIDDFCFMFDRELRVHSWRGLPSGLGVARAWFSTVFFFFFNQTNALGKSGFIWPKLRTIP
jgi:hypothetical protein